MTIRLASHDFRDSFVGLKQPEILWLGPVAEVNFWIFGDNSRIRHTWRSLEILVRSETYIWLHDIDAMAIICFNLAYPLEIRPY